MDSIGPFLYTSMRFFLGAFFVTPFAIREWQKAHQTDVKLFTKSQNRLMLIIGVAIFGGIIFQQIGIKYTSVTNASVLTAVYIPLVPLVDFILFRQPPKAISIFAALLSFLGIYIPSLLFEQLDDSVIQLKNINHKPFIRRLDDFVEDLQKAKNPKGKLDITKI